MKGKVGCTTQLSQEFRNRAVAADQPEASIERPQIRERRRHAETGSPGHAVVSEDNVGTRRLADMAGACDALAPIDGASTPIAHESFATGANGSDTS